MACLLDTSTFESPPAPLGAHCWICLDDGPSEKDGGRLLRNCACRGDSAGFAHVSCAAEHARRAFDNLRAAGTAASKPVDGPWTVCPNCEQEYTGDMAMAMAESFWKLAKDAPEVSFLRFQARSCLATTCLICGYDDRAQGHYEYLLKFLETAEEKTDKCGPKVFDRKADILTSLALIYSSKADKTVPSKKIYFRKAYNCITKAYELKLNLHSAESLDVIQTGGLLQRMKQAYDWVCRGVRSKAPCSTGDSLRKARTDYALTVEKYGEEARLSLLTAKTLVEELQEHGNASEAAELLDETLAKAKRVLGPSHELTLCIAKATSKEVSTTNIATAAAIKISGKTVVKATIVGVPKRAEINLTEVDVLRPTKDGKYIVRLQTQCKFKALKENLAFASGTTVVVQSLTKSRHLNGQQGTIESYDERRKRYTVAIGDNFRRFIEVDNMEIVFQS